MWGKEKTEVIRLGVVQIQRVYYIRQMGQQDSKPEAIQTRVSPRKESQQAVSGQLNSRLCSKSNVRVDCEGVLKLQTTPFKNSIEIQTDSQILFLENVEVTLKQLLESRLNTNKLFMLEDIERLVEAVTFTLANLQEKSVTYKDITPDSIFYDQGNFKLLPNELIEFSTYQKLREDNETLPSPQLIIALRCGEEDIVDEDILQKSNVFTLGMVLLEVATLLPSTDCYDSENYDILDSVINERIILVEEYYGDKVARIIANMLDYDYTERMNLRDLSIWINRQLAPSRVSENQIENVGVNSLLMSKSEKTVVAEIKATPSVMTEDKGKSRVRQAKNNSVYMGGLNNSTSQCSKQDRNRIYIHENPRHDENSNRNYYHENKALPLKKSMSIFENMNKGSMDKIGFMNNQSFSDMESFKFNDSINNKEIKQPHPYQYCDDYKMSLAKKDGPYDRSLVDRQTTTKRIAKEPTRPFRNQPQQEQRPQMQQKACDSKREKAPLKQISNQYYPNIDQILKSKASSASVEIKGPMGDSGALSRIKEQILKSRKLIEEFKRSEGLKF